MGTVAREVLVLQNDTERSPERSCVTHPTRTDAHVSFHCTGFGKFHNVRANPTEQLMSLLPKYLKGAPLPSTCNLLSCTVLQTAAQRVSTELEHLHRTPACPPPGMSSRRTVFIHFGVNVAVSRFELELQGRNEASFSCPDQAGWSPIKHRIDPDQPHGLEHVRKTRLPIARLAKSLEEKGFRVGTSSDAGRFVCNWTYYNSLRHAEQSGADCLFVHVPPTEEIQIEEHLRFFCALLEGIANEILFPAQLSHL